MNGFLLRYRPPNCQAREGRGEADGDAAAEVEGGAADVARLEALGRRDGERRERGVRAEEANGQEQPVLGGKLAAWLPERDEQAKYERAGDVGDEGAYEGRAHEVYHGEIDGVTRDRSQRAATGYVHPLNQCSLLPFNVC